MDTQSARSTGQARAASRPFVGAIVNYTSVGGDALTRGQLYAATITRLNNGNDIVSLHVTAPNAQFDLVGVRFSPTPEIGAWTWPG